jgi:NTE family protein
MMNAIFLDSMESDVERLEKMNLMLKTMENKHHWREIPFLMLRPSRDLGAMTEKLNRELPRTLRYLLRTIGVTGQEGLDLLSYLAFDSSYTVPLIELGYEDTMSRKEEIERFFES